MRLASSLFLALSLVAVPALASEDSFDACSRFAPDGNGIAINANVCVFDAYEVGELDAKQVFFEESVTIYKTGDYFAMVGSFEELTSYGDDAEVVAVAYAVGLGAARCASHAGCRAAVVRGAKWLGNAAAGGAAWDVLKSFISSSEE